MSTRNDVTGDALVSKKSSAAFRDNWDRIFKKSEPLKDEYSAHDKASEETEEPTEGTEEDED